MSLLNISSKTNIQFRLKNKNGNNFFKKMKKLTIQNRQKKKDNKTQPLTTLITNLHFN